MRAIKLLLAISMALTAQMITAQTGGEKLSLMGPEMAKNQWAWTTIGLIQGDKMSPVEYEWRNGEVTIETVCRNANANYGYDECLVAAKILFAERCIDLKEDGYCRAFSRIKLL